MVIKRNGDKVEYDNKKIRSALEKAFEEVDGKITKESKNIIDRIIKLVDVYYENNQDSRNFFNPTDGQHGKGRKNIHDIHVETIQDKIENSLMGSTRKDVARAYIRYRYMRETARNTTDNTIMELLGGENEYWNTENSNKNPVLATVQRDYIAGITSTDITERILLPKDVVEADKTGIIHFHDKDYFVQSLTNCCLINLEDMLQNGTVINKVKIDKPHRFLTAMTIATQIITAVTSSQYGGTTISLTHLAPFVRSSYEYYVNKYLNVFDFTYEKAMIYAKFDLKKEIADGVQTFNYQCNSMTTTNGQAPFLSVAMYLGETEEYKPELAMIIREFLDQRILGMKNEQGVYITQAFPKLLYVLEEDNINEDSKYYYLTELAARCTAKRMVPDYISEKIMKESKIDKNGNGNCYPCMGCRAYLTPFLDKNGNPKYYGRMNIGVVTLNLPDIALSSKGNFEIFWDLFEERTELCHKALQCRINRLKDTPSDVAPIMWQHGALARLKPGEKIGQLFTGGYATVSLGYAGLYECVQYMLDQSHSTPMGKQFALGIMQALNDKCAEWKAEENIDYSVYGTPIESTTYKFASCLKKRFGIIPGITDKNYITNSYHVNVREKIDPFTKLKIESEFQKLSPGGAISYIECSDLTNNIPAIMEVIKFIYENIMYAELNTKSDYCHECGNDTEIKVVSENGELIWECPRCGNRDKTKMNVTRRVCGYLGTNFWNKGRTEEIAERYVHLDNHNMGE